MTGNAGAKRRLTGILWALASLASAAGAETTTAVAASSTTGTVSTTPPWSAFRDDVLSGPFTLRFTLRKPDGRAASGKKWELAAGGLMPGDPPRRAVTSGTAPEDGTVQISGLAGVESPVSAEQLRSERRFAPWFSVWVDGRMLGQVAFFEWGKLGERQRVEEYLPPAGGAKVREREYRLPPDVGETAPDFAAMEVGTSRTVQLSQLRGQIVLLEFWSSKCHSCEGVLTKAHEALSRHGQAWQGKAQILALALDADPQAVERFVRDKGWKGIRFLWSGDGGTGRYSSAAQAYAVTGTPVAVLIDKDGRILWRGNGRELNIEATFERLFSR